MELVKVAVDAHEDRHAKREAEIAAARECVREVDRPRAEKYAITFTAQEVHDLHWLLLEVRSGDQEYVCPKCGEDFEQAEDTVVYCSKCGTRLKQETDTMDALQERYGITDERFYRVWDKVSVAANR